MTAMNMETYKKAVAEGKPFLAEFWAPWCSYCRKIGPALEKVAAKYEGRVLIGQVNIDEEPLIASEEQIEVIPTMIFYRDGKVLGSIVAPDSKAKIEAFLDENLAK